MLWCAYHTNDSIEWSSQIHHYVNVNLEGFELANELIKVARHHGILESYKYFLHENNLKDFIPTDLESVD